KTLPVLEHCLWRATCHRSIAKRVRVSRESNRVMNAQCRRIESVTRNHLANYPIKLRLIGLKPRERAGYPAGEKCGGVRGSNLLRIWHGRVRNTDEMRENIRARLYRFECVCLSSVRDRTKPFLVRFVDR